MLTKDEIDAGAKAIYALWANKPGYVPWVPNGNSTMQDEARRLARVAIAAHTRKVLEDVEPVAWLDTVIDWTATGQPITRRICIQAQCGDWALSYIESALRETATTVAALKLQRDALQARVDALEKGAERLWIDTEFNEFRGELISIAIVDEQGREFYEVLPPPLAGYGPWVAQHVVPILHKKAITMAELQAKLHAFLAGYKSAHLVADWPEDIEHFLRLLIVGPGQRIGPDRWTMEVRRDLPNTADTSAIPHNALEDAKALRLAHIALDSAALAAKGQAS